MLIIDVNIRPGEKKQIIVYEGDTAEKLATNFVNENGLDLSVKTKLQTMVQSQLNKVLPRIYEEEVFNTTHSEEKLSDT